MRDPFNPNIAEGGVFDVDYSLFEVKYRPEERVSNPNFKNSRRVSFTFLGKPAQQISIAGDFNSWDPYQTPLTESPKGSGRFTASFGVGPGRHHYCFIVDGVRIADPYNPRKLYDRDGKIVSYFEVAP
jgi:1,4-alpha-glucan branching enzyme